MATLTEQAVSEYFAAIRAMDVERWISLFAPDAVSHDPVDGPPPLVGHDALRAFLTHMMASFRRVSLTEQSVFIRGKAAAVKFTGWVESKTGKRVEFEGIDVIDCNEQGKITLVRAFWDPTPVMAALEK
jgi:steroid delta-isomerase